MKLAVILLALCSPAFGATLYTAPVEAFPVFNQVVWCEAVNVSGTPVTITVAVVDGSHGNTEISYTCLTTASLPGCATSWADSAETFYYCRIDTNTASKTTVRGRVAVQDPISGTFSQSMDAN